MFCSRQFLLISIGLFSSLFLATTSEAAKSTKKDSDRGQAIYMANCEACHLLTGENVINPRKPIVKSEKITDVSTFTTFISEKHGVMPAFTNLSKDSIATKQLYKFVRSLKNQSWQYPSQDDDVQDEKTK